MNTLSPDDDVSELSTITRPEVRRLHNADVETIGELVTWRAKDLRVQCGLNVDDLHGYIRRATNRIEKTSTVEDLDVSREFVESLMETA